MLYIFHIESSQVDMFSLKLWYFLFFLVVDLTPGGRFTISAFFPGGRFSVPRGTIFPGGGFRISAKVNRGVIIMECRVSFQGNSGLVAEALHVSGIRDKVTPWLRVPLCS